jgi:cob(I)alamin adenosyltransferase
MVFSGHGDDGTTGLLGSGRVPKSDLRMETLGTMDEANAALGMARSLMEQASEAEMLLGIQRQLYHMMAEIAATPENSARFMQIDAQTVKGLETHIDRLNDQVRLPGEFIVPGDSTVSAAVSVARTIVRRAERRVVELITRGLVTNPELTAYLNRLSSLLFILELYVLQHSGKGKPTLAKGI